MCRFKMSRLVVFFTDLMSGRPPIKRRVQKWPLDVLVDLPTEGASIFMKVQFWLGSSKDLLSGDGNYIF